MVGTSLSEVPLFAKLSPDELACLATRMRRRRFPAGHAIFSQDDPGAALYVIEGGRVRISRLSPDGKEIELARLGPGEFFGEIALLDGGPRSANVTTLEPCELSELSRDEFVHFVEAHPKIALPMLVVVGQRLRVADQLIEDALFLDVPARLARALADLSETYGHAEAEGIVLELRLTQAELGTMVGASRESVNRWLTYFERHRLARFERGRFVILDLEGLRRRIY